MVGVSSLIGRLHVGTLPQKPAGQARLYKYIVQAQGLEGTSALGQV